MCRFEEAARAKSIKRVGGARQGGWWSTCNRMGACFCKLFSTGKRYKDELLNPKASAAVVPACISPPHEDGATKGGRVQLIGDILCPFTLRVRIALQHKVIIAPKP
jgi:hypothetical protein